MRALAVAFCLCASFSAAKAPDSSLRPVSLRASSVETSPVPARFAPGQSLRPISAVRVAAPRNVVPLTRPEPALMREAPAAAEQNTSVHAASLSLRPLLRPKAIEQKAMAKRRKLRQGAVCGDLDLQGEEIGTVPGRISGCGVKNAVRLRSVSGVTLSQPSTMDCNTANALNRWVVRSAAPALKGKGGGLVRLRVAAHYACRTRNNQPGARISEHGKGRAIDISGFQLRDGREITVLQGWNAAESSRALRRMHKGACGHFGTVLGPNSDRFHRDHFHFDTARYRSGPYCR